MTTLLMLQALFKLLIRDTLQRDPEFRPSARQILERRLPDLMAPFLHIRPQPLPLPAESFIQADDAPANAAESSPAIIPE